MEHLGTVALLEEEPHLLDLVPERQQAAARRALTAAVYRFGTGSWDPRALFPHGRTYFGLLVLHGLLLRDVAVAETTCGELVGAGELLRPWDSFGRTAPTPFEIEWKVIEPARVAVLDSEFGKVISVWPALGNAFIERAVERSHSLALHVAIHCIRRVDVSLVVLFSHLADRFGNVTESGTSVDVKLTQSDLGKLVGASRQSVSLALRQLAERGVLTRGEDGSWILTRDPPHELERMLAKRRPA